MAQSELDAIQMSRTISDAAFLSGGAIIENGQLYITPDQLTIVRQQYKSNADAIGQIALYDQSKILEASVLDTPVETLINQEMNRRQLHDDIDRLVGPYCHIFDEKIPRPGEIRKSRFGKIKNFTEWQQTINRNGLDVKHDFRVEFTGTNNDLVPMKAMVRLFISGSFNNYVEIDTGYDRGQLDSISIYFTKEGTVGQLLDGNDESSDGFSNMIKRLNPLTSGRRYVFSLGNTAIPKLTISYSNSGISSMCSYCYNPSTDRFDLVGQITESDRGELYSDPVVYSDRPAHLERAEFLDALSGALQIIPTTRLS